jgi:WYL domain
MEKLNQDGRRGAHWGLERRLRFIDFRLHWDGTFNRADLRERFGISVPQASLDIAKYTALAPHNLRYDRSTRTYVATTEFRKQYDTSGPHDYLTQLFALGRHVLDSGELMLGFRPPVATVPLPARAADETTLKSLLDAIRRHTSLEVEYWSIARDEPARRTLTPHALAHDGFRWHVRAYCHLRRGFRDFVIGRIVQVHRDLPTTVDSKDDAEWHRLLRLVLTPHPDLSPNQRKGIEIDFQMTDGKVAIECRQAMLFYLLRALGLDNAGRPLPGTAHQVVFDNLSELSPFLPTPGQP